MREGRDPERDPQARALREAVGEAQEEGPRREEARPQEGAQRHDVALPRSRGSLRPRLPAGAGPIVGKEPPGPGMLIERIDSELKDAARARDKQRLGTLRMLKSALKYREIETGKELSDAEVVQVAQTLIKQRRDSAGQFRSGGRPELAQNEEAEIVILESFLPRQLGDDELAQLASEAIAET